MPRSVPRRPADSEIHEDSNCLSHTMNEEKDTQHLGGDEISIAEGKDNGEAWSQSKDPQRDTEERDGMEESEMGGDSVLDQELSDLQEDGSILQDTKPKHDETYEQNPHSGQDGTESTHDTTKATLEEDAQTEDEGSILHHDLCCTDAENEGGDTSGEDGAGGDEASHYGDVEDDVSSDDSGASPRFSLGSEDEAPHAVNMSNRSSWRSNRPFDLSKEARQLVELNSPVVGEEAATESIISRIPSGASHASAPRARDSFCSPRKVQRHPFRTPSDIRAMQMYSPAPSLFSTPQSSKRQHPTVSHLGTPTGSQYSKSRTPTRFRKNREDSPLVLLHVTVLPLRWQYAKAIVAPELPANLYNIREAYYLLHEKLSDTILSRGILLPHPQDSYECLEERFLDALELPVRPRAKILRCGHYMGPNVPSSDDDSADEGDSGLGSTGRFKNRPDKIWCDICRRDIRCENDDQDEDVKKFNVKVFASNGLMRSGAWAAAWREMERVDVEIEPLVQPWMVEDMEDLIERMREAEERERDDSFGQYSSDDEDRESLGSEAQRLHEEEMAKVTLRQKTVNAESRNAREHWLAAASKAAEDEATRMSRETEILRLKEAEAARVRVREEDVKRLEGMKAARKAEEEADRLRLEVETLRIRREEVERLRIEAEVEAIRLAEEAQKVADLQVESSKTEENDQNAQELEAEVQRLHEEEMAANQASEEEAQLVHEAELVGQKSIEEGRRISDAEFAEQEVLEEEAKRIMDEEETSRKATDDGGFKSKLQEQEKSTEEARRKDNYDQASMRKKEPSSSSRSHTSTGNESLTELLIKAAGVAMRDRKIILIVVLSVIILFLALRASNEVAMPKYAPDIIIQNHRYELENQGVDHRGFESLRQAAAEENLQMREIESSAGWRGQEVVATNSKRTAQKPIMVQSEIAADRKKQPVLMEIEAPDAVPNARGRFIEDHTATPGATPGAVENVEAGLETVSVSRSDLQS